MDAKPPSPHTVTDFPWPRIPKSCPLSPVPVCWDGGEGRGEGERRDRSSSERCGRRFPVGPGISRRRLSPRVERLLAICVTLLCWLPRFSLGEPQLQYGVRTIPLGNGQVDVVSRHVGPQRWLLCNLHDDENTSVDAALGVLTRFPGRLVELQNGGRRNITFELSGRHFTFDPNRIFTVQGIRTTLKQLSHVDEHATRAIMSFGRELLEYYDLDHVQAVIALHNNSDGNYSLSSYLPGQSLAGDALSVHRNESQDVDDFFFVTDQNLFTALSAGKFNVVLQDNRRVTDDGSLSVYFGRKGIPYVNVEAQHGHLEQQSSMLLALMEYFEARAGHAETEGAVTPEVGGLPAQPSKPNMELVNLKQMEPTLVIEARYATSNNFVGRPLYPATDLYLERGAAERLQRVQAALQRQGLGLKVWDAYRPLSIQKEMWRILPDTRYVADPAVGSRHNRGSAVDVTLIDSQGHELPMPTAFDEFTEKAHRDYSQLSPEVIRNRKTLEEAMVAEQFEPLATEWWHFDAPEWKQFPVSNQNPYAQPFPAAETSR